MFTTHITASVGGVGAAMVFLALAVIGVTSDDERTVRGAYLVMAPAAWFPVPALSATSLIRYVVAMGLLLNDRGTFGLDPCDSLHDIAKAAGAARVPHFAGAATGRDMVSDPLRSVAPTRLYELPSHRRLILVEAVTDPARAGGLLLPDRHTEVRRVVDVPLVVEVHDRARGVGAESKSPFANGSECGLEQQGLDGEQFDRDALRAALRTSRRYGCKHAVGRSATGAHACHKYPPWSALQSQALSGPGYNHGYLASCASRASARV
jgi:hypothetical protein